MIFFSGCSERIEETLREL